VNFDPPLEPATLLRRYQRFLADVEDAAGRVLTVHVPNSGSMATCLAPRAPVLLSRSANPARRLSHTLEMVRDEAGWIVVNTLRANTMAREALEAGQVPGFPRDWLWRPEVKRGDSRLDFHGTRAGQEAWVEVKSVTLRLEDGWAGFPDSVTTRGQKHLREAAHIDPAWAAALGEAVAAGVEVQALQVLGDAVGLRLAGTIPVVLA